MSNIFSVSVIKQTKKEFREDIRDAILGDANLKKEIQKTLQQANRRMQNIETAKLASPAAKAVIAERGKQNYTYFSVSRLNPKNKTDWEVIKYEYGRALAFLNNPTSTATGARQYIKYQAHKLNDIPFESANKIVDLATSPTIDRYGNVNIFSYKELLDEYTDYIDETDSTMRENANEYASQLEQNLNNAVNNTTDDLYNLLDRL